MADLEKVAAALKTAAARIIELEAENQKLAVDNELQTLQLIAKERSGRAVKLANEMCSFGMIKLADVESEVDRLMEMDDNAFASVKEVVNRMSSIEKTAAPGVDTLSGLLGGFSLGEGASGGRKTLSQAIVEG